jgi:predicted phage-related endonuclease
MRVTKKVENYIREQVKAKVMPKYEAEKAESLHIFKAKKDIENRIFEATKQAAMAALVEAKECYGDIFELDEGFLKDSYPNFYHPIHIKNLCLTNSVHNWSHRMLEEVNEITNNIIVTLELGGNKADLDRMLSEI